MRGGFRRFVPVSSDLSDKELIEHTRIFRRAFNQHYRVHGCAQAAEAFATALAAVPRQRLLADLESQSADRA